MKAPKDDEGLFWSAAEPHLEREGVTRSTMMGLPCLRINGAFYASFDHRSGSLLVKLPATRVEALVGAGQAEEFAPAGRRFREWASIPIKRVRAWPLLLDEAHAHVAALAPAPPKRKR